jgi:hypothetical protein
MAYGIELCFLQDEKRKKIQTREETMTTLFLESFSSLDLIQKVP